MLLSIVNKKDVTINEKLLKDSISSNLFSIHYLNENIIDFHQEMMILNLNYGRMSHYSGQRYLTFSSIWIFISTFLDENRNNLTLRISPDIAREQLNLSMSFQRPLYVLQLPTDRSIRRGSTSVLKPIILDYKSLHNLLIYEYKFRNFLQHQEIKRACLIIIRRKRTIFFLVNIFGICCNINFNIWLSSQNISPQCIQK